jgi:hypothetical protein
MRGRGIGCLDVDKNFDPVLASQLKIPLPLKHIVLQKSFF